MGMTMMMGMAEVKVQDRSLLLILLLITSIE